MNILLVEDDLVIADAVCVYLQSKLMQVTHAVTLSEAKHYVSINQFDVCLLDIALPDGSGLELLSLVRKKKLPMAIILLTARDAIEDKVTGLNNGADDYVTKPFDFEELIARIYSVTRRQDQHLHEILKFEELTFDAKAKRVEVRGEQLSLSACELKLLYLFLSNPGRILSEAQLKDYLYGVNDDVNSNALNVHLFNLRKKVGKHIIITERGLGYRLAHQQE